MLLAAAVGPAYVRRAAAMMGRDVGATGGGGVMDTDAAVRELADDVHDLAMAHSPLEASLVGDHRFDADVPDLTPLGRDAARRAVTALRGRIDRIDLDALSTTDRVTLDVCRHVTDQLDHELDDRYVRAAVGPMTSGAAIGSAASAVIAGMPKLALAVPAHADDLLTRCRRIPGWLAAAEAQLRLGVRQGIVPPARLVAATVRQLDRYLATAPDDDPLLVDAPPDLDAARWRALLGDVLASTVRPALAAHRAVLADEIAAAGRPDDRAGMCHLPDGLDLYREAVRIHTTTGHGPEHWHQLGLDVLAALDDEYRHLGARVLGISAPADIFARLREDPALRFATSGQVFDAAAAALARAQAAVGDWFAGVPVIPCEVREIPLIEAPESTIAYYQPPALDGTRPGVYFVNTTEPQTRPLFEAEALAFHESVPGHHTQIATAMELDLPTLRRVRYLTAHAEGWGLYVERLADEMGLYSDDLSRLGMLSYDSWRACRLVVDTGMHAHGWSRDRAVDFMLDRSPQAPGNIANEVDRYLGWPGQALAYMAGRTAIVALRDRARRTLGDRFAIADFHAQVLGHAAVPLRTLDRLIDGWLADVQASGLTRPR
jgi:uncharacterized protein (DUF885 family)